MVNYSLAARHLNSLRNDTMTVWRTTNTLNDVFTDQTRTVIYENVPCRLARCDQITDDNWKDTPTIVDAFQVLYSTEYTLLDADEIEVVAAGRTYKGLVGNTMVYQTHNETVFETKEVF